MPPSPFFFSQTPWVLFDSHWASFQPFRGATAASRGPVQGRGEALGDGHSHAAPARAAGALKGRVSRIGESGEEFRREFGQLAKSKQQDRLGGGSGGLVSRRDFARSCSGACSLPRLVLIFLTCVFSLCGLLRGPVHGRASETESRRRQVCRVPLVKICKASAVGPTVADRSSASGKRWLLPIRQQGRLESRGLLSLADICRPCSGVLPGAGFG